MKPSEIFLELVELGGVPHGYEDAVYQDLLSQQGFTYVKGNYHKPGTLPIVLTAHLDTVHDSPGPHPFLVEDNFVHTNGLSILGADDKAGVALILYLAHKLPVHFVLFYGEEYGLLGSKSMASDIQRQPNALNKALVMLSLDRQGTTDVVWHQLGAPTANHEVAAWLARALSKNGDYQFQPAEGIFTDSYAFQNLIPNCMNLSVGYYNAHSTRELQNLTYLDWLGERLLDLNWEALVQQAKQYEDGPLSLYRTDWDEILFTDRWAAINDLHAYLSCDSHALYDFLCDLKDLQIQEVELLMDAYLNH